MKQMISSVSLKQNVDRGTKLINLGSVGFFWDIEAWDTLQTLCFGNSRFRNFVFQTVADTLPIFCFANTRFRNIVFQLVTDTLEKHFSKTLFWKHFLTFFFENSMPIHFSAVFLKLELNAIPGGLQNATLHSWYRYTTFFSKTKFAKLGFWNFVLQICSRYNTDTLFGKLQLNGVENWNGAKFYIRQNTNK